MTDYWIWSNQQRGWWKSGKLGYTNLLHEAGRYAEPVAREILAQCNLAVAAQDWPNEVLIPVTNDYLFAAGREILDEYERTGDRGPLDAVRWRAQDEALVASVEFQESLQQMLRGEGRILGERDEDVRADGD
jgi:hypothetical protein